MGTYTYNDEGWIFGGENHLCKYSSQKKGGRVRCGSSSSEPRLKKEFFLGLGQEESMIFGSQEIEQAQYQEGGRGGEKSTSKPSKLKQSEIGNACCQLYQPRSHESKKEKSNLSEELRGRIRNT